MWDTQWLSRPLSWRSHTTISQSSLSFVAAVQGPEDQPGVDVQGQMAPYCGPETPLKSQVSGSSHAVRRIMGEGSMRQVPVSKLQVPPLPRRISTMNLLFIKETVVSVSLPPSPCAASLGVSIAVKTRKATLTKDI